MHHGNGGVLEFAIGDDAHLGIGSQAIDQAPQYPAGEDDLVLVLDLPPHGSGGVEDEESTVGAPPPCGAVWARVIGASPPHSSTATVANKIILRGIRISLDGNAGMFYQGWRRGLEARPSRGGAPVRDILVPLVPERGAFSREST